MRLEVRNLSFSYPGRQVLRNVSFCAEAGQFLSVLGANGAGKSTLFKCILGLLPRYSGEILLDGRSIRELSPRDMAKRLAYIPQIARPAFSYSVLETVLMGTTHTLSPVSVPKAEQLDRAWAALRRLNMTHLAERDYRQLSGGEQQLVLAARALAQESRILVMDEPTASLDYGNQLRMLDQVRQLTEDGYTVLLSTHHPQHALRYAHRLLALKDGGVAAFGNTAEVLTGELIGSLYGVETDFIETGHGPVIVPVSGNGTKNTEGKEQ